MRGRENITRVRIFLDYLRKSMIASPPVSETFAIANVSMGVGYAPSLHSRGDLRSESRRFRTNGWSSHRRSNRSQRQHRRGGHGYHHQLADECLAHDDYK